MLTCLRVRNFAIIEELEVDLDAGLNIVTGETGAGKSILVDALQLVLGARGRPEVVRTDAEAAEVEALFDVSGDLGALNTLREQGLETEGELIVRRVVNASGRTRAYINGRLATLGQLREVTKGLADISSQHEFHSLADPRQHLTYLDAFGDHGRLLEEVGAAHTMLVEVAARLEEVVSEERGRADREDLLRFQIGEIDAVADVLDKEDALFRERERLRHAEHLGSAAGEAEAQLYAEDDAICGSLSRIATSVQQASRFDPALAAIADQIKDALVQLEDAASELGRYARDLSFDPRRLAQLEEQLDQLQRIKRKYGGKRAEVIAHRDQARTELDSLERYEERVDGAQREYDETLARATTAALSLRKKRQAAAKRLSKAISQELASLGMGEAKVTVELAALEGGPRELQVEGARLTPSGIDRAELLIAPNRGEEAKPLRKIASGGELSRSMLAIKRVLAGLGPASLYVFDEVDAGVGGAVAEVIGRKIHDVAQHSQVLCITHLPQISVYADAHYRVHKEVVGERTKSDIRLLSDTERLEEIARMLGGVQVTEQARAAAEQLLQGANA
ncbi:MAG: DNA repair protein RecN [Myxococcales bacterium]|nr:DNA repair protein RecN [Myxococcales bacterium]MDH3483363.1 DNA repair protein RecN [Myxococcales bacterium]